MKRTPLKRKTAMSRGKSIRPRMRGVDEPRPERKKTKYARRERDWEWMGWIKQQPCCMLQMQEWRVRRDHPQGDVALCRWMGPLAFYGCRGTTEAHHAGVRGLGQKAPDDTCIPLCEAHHRGDDIGITRRRGPFSGWPHGSLKEWELAMVAHYSASYAAYRSVVDSAPF